MTTTLLSSSFSKLNLATLSSLIGWCLVLLCPSVSLTVPKDLVYNTCACLCEGATGGAIIDIGNSGGYTCGLYNNKTCNYEDPATGGIRSGTTKYCGGYKPDGVKATMFQAPLSMESMTKDAITRRGIEGDQPPAEPGPGPYGPSEASSESTKSDIQERAIPRTGLGVAELNCSCDKGSGTCSVTSTDGTSSKCYKGTNDTCTGTCMYPKGTVSGFTGGLMRQ